MEKITNKKCILHIDGDAFFVGVEVAKNPKLKGLPVVTGQERGIVTALSYEAKALGVVRGMPTSKVKKTWPKIIILPGDYKSYVKYSELMFDIVRRYADIVEEYSIDECFADLTGYDRILKLSYLEIAQKIKDEISNELKLSVSIGLAPTKVLAKVASKWQKPNGLTVIEKEKVDFYLSKTPLGKIWGIGPKSAEKLNKMGLILAFDFINKDLTWIKTNLHKPAEILWRELKGESLLMVNQKPKEDFSSIQKTRSFYPANSDRDFLLSQLSKHTEEACLKARHFDLKTNRFTFFLKTKNFDYQNLTINLSSFTNSPEIIFSLIQKHLPNIFQKNKLYRTTGIVLHNLTKKHLIQDGLFISASKSNKFDIIHEQIDKLEEKFGSKAVYLASSQKALKNNPGGTDSDDLDRDLLFL